MNFADELHALSIGRNIIKNLHMAANHRMENGRHNTSDYKEPLYDIEELRSIAPTDLKQSFDIRSIIARTVDGSEFDEFKKLYGTVRAILSLKSLYALKYKLQKYRLSCLRSASAISSL